MTDTGHEGGSASFALGHPEKLIDWGYRADHEMTVKSKAIIAAFYGEAPKLSYWNGCSAGGRQALKEAQKYPGRFQRHRRRIARRQLDRALDAGRLDRAGQPQG